LLDPIAVEEAMKGVDKLFLLNAVSADALTQALITFGLARMLNLKHLTYLSVFKVEQFRDVPHFASKLAVEARCVNSVYHTPSFVLAITFKRRDAQGPRRGSTAYIIRRVDR
jgi:hypothetical protein